MSKTISRLFDSHTSALAAVDDLMAEGVEFVHPIHHN